MSKPVRIRIDFKGEDAEKFLYVQNHLGLKNSTEVVRYLIQKEAETIGPPRFEQINLDESGTKILDRTLQQVVQIHFKPQGIICENCQTNNCPHITFALSKPNIQNIIRKKRKEGWNLPEV